MPDKIFRTEKGKFMAVSREIKERNQKGQPILIGTVSIEKNELLSALLKKEGIAHNVLNAKNHEKEAQIIAEAGRVGAVTVATNMAGRGVDIILGGRAQLAHSPAQLGGKSILGEDWQKENDKVIQAGGLHIIGTERHEARRIDNQLRGRAGRQGDPGSSQFFVSLEDDLMRIFGSDKIKRMMEIFNLPEDEPIENKMISRALESAQGKIEGFNFDIRNHVLEYDDVMNRQRETIYRKRKEILTGVVEDKSPNGDNMAVLDDEREILVPESQNIFRNGSLKEQISEMIRSEIGKFVEFHTQENYAENWNLTEISETANSIFGLSEEEKSNVKDFKDREELIEYLNKLAEEKYGQKEKQFGAENMRAVEKGIMLQTIDTLWMDHLDNMDHLRDSVRLRAYGQRDPLVEYKNEGHRLFQQLLGNIHAQIVNIIFKVESAQPVMPKRPSIAVENIQPSGVGAPLGNSAIGRNAPCPCGSGKKYKKCCGK
jgi:preprotein translocase subunit SecA